MKKDPKGSVPEIVPQASLGFFVDEGKGGSASQL